MTWERYDLELLTWTFCSGADQKRAEVRIPSIRGQVRWWFRALGGTWEEERAVFGGVLGDQPRRSAVVMRLAEPVVADRAVNLQDLDLAKDPELGYLLFPLRPTKAAGDQRRGVIEPEKGNRFQLLVGWRRPVVEEALQTRLRLALQAWILLGGLGTRSRRGFGSVWPQEDRLPETALRTLEDVRTRLKFLAGRSRKHPRVMTLGPGSSDWKEALRKAAKWLKDYRTGSTSFGQRPSKWGRNDHDAALGKSNCLYRPVLGLPLEQRFRSDSLHYRTLHLRFMDRWASPVHLKVIRLGEKYYPLAVFFPEHAMAEGDQVSLQPVDQKGGGRTLELRVSRGLLEAMMREVPSEGQVLLE